MCYIVLNLQMQVGARAGVSALAEAYRVRSATLSPILRVLAQNRLCSNHEHHRAIILYHKLILLTRLTNRNHPWSQLATAT